jgi:D-alanyl-D-alanine carboxypeptidase/D-alanyl-D-alanine-endopeptidase (penicillin-binding protein 4)
VRAVPEAVPIGALRSAPLRELLRRMLVHSDNLYAECIARALDRRPVAESRVAREWIDDTLRQAGVQPGRVSLVDGSGLSRYSLVTAEGMVQLSAWVERQPWGPELISLLPVAGREGTLAGRMLGTPAEGRVAGKTGSMTGVRNMVGFVDTAEGERLRFAFLINGFSAPQTEAIAVQDRVLALIAASDGRKVSRRTAALLGTPGQ